MNYQRPAYEQVMIAHGGSTVTLRPSLRAAVTLEARYGFPSLFRALDDLNLTIISEIILAACSRREDAAAFLLPILGRPLFPFLIAVRQPLAQLVSMLTPAPDPKAKPSTGSGIPWSEFYRGLYRAATGGLGWTPEATWNATPTEIDEALIGRFGAGEDKRTRAAPDPEQAARDVAQGRDPEFNRAGVEALRGSILRTGR